MRILLLPIYLGGTFSPLLDISERNYLRRWEGGGGARAPSAPPFPAYAPALVFENTKPSSKSRHYPSVTNQSSVSNYKNLPYSPKSVAVQQIY